MKLRYYRRRSRNGKRIVFILLCCGMAGVACIAAGIGIYMYNHWRDEPNYNSLAGPLTDPGALTRAALEIAARLPEGEPEALTLGP